MSKKIERGDVMEEAKTKAAAIQAGDDVATVESGRVDAVVARMVDVRNSGVSTITAEAVHLQNGGVQNVRAETVYLENGGIVRAQGDTIALAQGGIGLARGDAVVLDGGSAGAIVAARAEVRDSSVVFLAARKVSGDVDVVFDMRSAVVFGLVTGMVLGLFRMFQGLGKT